MNCLCMMLALLFGKLMIVCDMYFIKVFVLLLLLLVVVVVVVLNQNWAYKNFRMIFKSDE